MPTHPGRRRVTLVAAALAFTCLLTLLSCGDDDSVDIRESGSGDTARPTLAPTTDAILIVGPGETYETIAAAVSDAPDGATISVRAGTYYEQVEIDRRLTIQPAGDGPVIIDGECERDHGVWIPTGSGATISGLEVRNTAEAGVLVGLGPPEEPLADSVVLEDLTISDFNCNDGEIPANAGIAVWHAGCCMTVRGNTITYRSDGDLRGLANGIWFKSNSEVPSGGGHTITGNVIRGGWDGIGGETESDDHGTFDRDTLIEGNSVSDCLDDGIQVEGGNQNVRVVDNEISGCASGIAFAPTLIGPLYVERNVIRDLEEGVFNNRSCFKLGYDAEGIIYLTENICDTRGDGLLQSNAGTSPIVSRRNCIHVTGVTIGIGDIRGMDLQEDHLWTTSRETFAGWDGEDYPSLRDFQEATGQEDSAVNSPDCPLAP